MSLKVDRRREVEGTHVKLDELVRAAARDPCVDLRGGRRVRHDRAALGPGRARNLAGDSYVVRPVDRAGRGEKSRPELGDGLRRAEREYRENEREQVPGARPHGATTVSVGRVYVVTEMLAVNCQLCVLGFTPSVGDSILRFRNTPCEVALPVTDEFLTAHSAHSYTASDVV